MAHISWSEVRDRAIRFSREWTGTSSESAEKQTFWNEFFEVFGLRRRSVATFEEPVQRIRGTYGKIDLFWPGIVLVEHKSFGEDLGVASSQAFSYIRDLTRERRTDEVPRFVVVSDFARFVLYDLEPEEQRDLPLWDQFRYTSTDFVLADLYKNVRHFAFLRGEKTLRLNPEDPANQKAYDLMCELHDELETGGFTGDQLEKLLVRILFCLFAEDTGLFEPNAFQSFVRRETREDGSDLGARLNELFDLLNTSPDKRSPEFDEDLAQFPYVNGELFADRLGFPRFNRAMRDKLLQCSEFQWAKISPAVFGSLFQGIMEKAERRQQGAQYTSERDIMKVLRSLFLDDLHEEFRTICADRSTRRRGRLQEFHTKLRGLNLLDPACGCGNFLVLAYRELRLLELDLLRELHAGQTRVLNIRELIRVDVDQFYGIEISAWPVEIARVALWLLDHQMNQRVSEAFGQYFQRLPLRSTPHIVIANALRIDWNVVLPRAKCSCVFGNPPFVGKRFMNREQNADMGIVFREIEGHGVLDYVTAWYVKAAEYIQTTPIRCAFVSTNSITQGEQVGLLWNHLFQRYRIKINFGHRTFSWISEAKGRAHVHVVILGFAGFDSSPKYIYDYDADENAAMVTEAHNISPYLVEGSDIVVTARREALATAPELSFGNMPNDGGHLLLSEKARQELIAVEPAAAEFIRPFLGPDEFLYNIPRWCLWLVDTSPAALRACPHVMERIEKVRAHREKSRREATNRLAATPSLFGEIRQPARRYLAIPKTSSERRAYIPIGFVEPVVIAGADLFTCPDAVLFHFGVLTSFMHMAWVRTVAGRLKSDFRYSAGIVYNNFPWPSPTPEQQAHVEEKARVVLAAREPHLPPRGMSTLADLYDPLIMPAALVRAHVELDREVEKCYRAEAFHSDRERVEFLFRLYEQLTAPLLPAAPRRRTVRARVPTPRRSQRARTPRLPSAER
jgi:hypothetical protein